MRPKPNLFLVGAPKCGTSAMALYLAKHPQICICNTKEPNYFCTDLDVGGVSSESDYLKLFQPRSNTKYMLDGSVLYMYSRVAARNIAQYNRNAMILIMLRNPVDVMHAWHSQMRFSCYESISQFEFAVEAESERRRGQLLPRAGIKRNCPQLLYYRSIVRFGEQIERVYKYFDSSQIHVILHEDMKGDIERTYVDTLEWLRIDTSYRPDFVPVNESRRRRSWRLHYLCKRMFAKPARLLLSGHRRVQLVKWIDRVNSQKAERPPADSEMRARLLAELRPDIDRLSGLIGRDCTHWYRS